MSTTVNSEVSWYQQTQAVKFQDKDKANAMEALRNINLDSWQVVAKDLDNVYTARVVVDFFQNHPEEIRHHGGIYVHAAMVVKKAQVAYAIEMKAQHDAEPDLMHYVKVVKEWWYGVKAAPNFQIALGVGLVGALIQLTR